MPEGSVSKTIGERFGIGSFQIAIWQMYFFMLINQRRLSSKESGVFEMAYLVALFLPFVSFFMIGKPAQGVVCLILQLTFFGWIPATIWAFVAIAGHNADKRNEKLVSAISSKSES